MSDNHDISDPDTEAAKFNLSYVSFSITINRTTELSSVKNISTTCLAQVKHSVQGKRSHQWHVCNASPLLSRAAMKI